MYCSKCGKPIDGNGGFCPNCGASIVKQSQETQNNNITEKAQVYNQNLTNVTSDKNSRYAILSVVLPSAMVLLWFLIPLPFLLILVVLSLSFDFARRGLNSSKKSLAKIGKIVNIILSVLVIAMWLLTAISQGAK